MGAGAGSHYVGVFAGGDCTMTRKDFELIASTIRTLTPAAHAEAAQAFADKLAGTNAGFNRDRFLRACDIGWGEQ